MRAADFAQTILRFRNNRWAAAVGLGDLSEAEWLRHFGRFEPLPDNLRQPLAFAVPRSSFRVYTPRSGRAGVFVRAAAGGRDGCLTLAPRGRGNAVQPVRRWAADLKAACARCSPPRCSKRSGSRPPRLLADRDREALERHDEPSRPLAVLVRLSTATSHRHFRGWRISAKSRTCGGSPMYAAPHFGEEAPPPPPLPEGEEGSASGCSAMSCAPRRGWRPHTSPPGSSTRAPRDNIVVTAESFDYGRGAFTPFWTVPSPPLFRSCGGSIRSGGQRRRDSTGTWCTRRLAPPHRESDALPPALEAFPERSAALVEAFSAGSAFVPRGADADTELVAAIETALGCKTGRESTAFLFDGTAGEDAAPRPQTRPMRMSLSPTSAG